METIVAAIAFGTALFGFLKEFISFIRSSPAGHPPRRPLLIIVWILILICSASFAIFINARNRDPVSFLFTRIVSFDKKTMKYSLFQTQSFFQPWALFPSSTTLVRRFEEHAANTDGEQARIQAAYFVGDISQNIAFPATVSREIESEIKPGQQYHIVIDAANAFSNGTQEPEDWYDCPEWTGLNYKLKGPERLSEFLIAIDFSQLAINGDCSGLFKKGTKPRFAWARPDITKEETEKSIGHPLKDVCGDEGVYKALDCPQVTLTK